MNPYLKKLTLILLAPAHAIDKLLECIREEDESIMNYSLYFLLSTFFLNIIICILNIISIRECAITIFGYALWVIVLGVGTKDELFYTAYYTVKVKILRLFPTRVKKEDIMGVSEYIAALKQKRQSNKDWTNEEEPTQNSTADNVEPIVNQSSDNNTLEEDNFIEEDGYTEYDEVEPAQSSGGFNDNPFDDENKEQVAEPSACNPIQSVILTKATSSAAMDDASNTKVSDTGINMMNKLNNPMGEMPMKAPMSKPMQQQPVAAPIQQETKAVNNGFNIDEEEDI